MGDDVTNWVVPFIYVNYIFPKSNSSVRPVNLIYPTIYLTELFLMYLHPYSSTMESVWYHWLISILLKGVAWYLRSSGYLPNLALISLCRRYLITEIIRTNNLYILPWGQITKHWSRGQAWIYVHSEAERAWEAKTYIILLVCQNPLIRWPFYRIYMHIVIRSYEAKLILMSKQPMGWCWHAPKTPTLLHNRENWQTLSFWRYQLCSLDKQWHSSPRSSFNLALTTHSKRITASNGWSSAQVAVHVTQLYHANPNLVS